MLSNLGSVCFSGWRRAGSGPEHLHGPLTCKACMFLCVCPAMLPGCSRSSKGLRCEPAGALGRCSWPSAVSGWLGAFCTPWNLYHWGVDDKMLHLHNFGCGLFGCSSKTTD